MRSECFVYVVIRSYQELTQHNKGEQMTNKYTIEDIPQILNSISWQLKRIADSLEKEDELPVDKPVQQSSNKPRSDIRKMLLEHLKPERD